VTDRVDDNLFFRDLVEDEKGIWGRRQTANSGIIRADANVGMSREQVNDVLYALLHALRPMG
jgi:hypothetical protein